LVTCGTGRAVVDTNQDKARARNAVLSDPEIKRLYADEYERRGRYAAEMLGSNFEESDFIKFIN
ncbi:MAG: hypothetical protein IJW24_01715, partial [Clostridia bacterium]|nr:hypothetical protein [Clostridia bacterium]